ncbi:M15 family metallopeptidase [Patescibacteria group bacterium]|nr:M15 family metallopeptidase [Patescibacteria group bacterium]
MNNKQKIDFDNLSQKEIPKIPELAGWKEIDVDAKLESLVPVGILSDFDIFTSSIYYSEHNNSPYKPNQLHGSNITIFLRQDVAKRLLQAERLLPTGYHLTIFDGWRSLEVQKSLYDEYHNALKNKFPNWDESMLSEETQKYVSLPSDDPNKPSPHNTGGSVDLAIIRLPNNIEDDLEKLSSDEEAERAKIILTHAEMLNFGTKFDWGGQEAALRYFEEQKEKRELSNEESKALKNRRILYHLMKTVGLEPYVDEWWHFNATQSQMGAKTAGLSVASYGSANLSDENIQFENKRKTLSKDIGRETSLPMAAIIKPPEK